ncbi:MAG: DUF92 domain-containing protein [Gemmatimonadaceae bacterium]
MIETIFLPAEYLLLPGRALAGLAAAAAVAVIAWRAGALTRSGCAAAVACGTLCAVGGWNWASLLIVYFVGTSALSHLTSRRTRERTAGILSKGERRDGLQVLANGGVYSIAAALTAAPSMPTWVAWGALGALSAAAADSWATEVGTWLGGRPRSIVSRTYVRQGESGGVTVMGFVGGFGGAGIVGISAMSLGFTSGLALATVVCGCVGAIVDSLLGATIQERRWCDACDEPTERTVHLCGSATRRAGGVAGLDNDVINLLSTVSGFVLGLIIYYLAETSG